MCCCAVSYSHRLLLDRAVVYRDGAFFPAQLASRVGCWLSGHAKQCVSMACAQCAACDNLPLDGTCH